MNQNKHARLGDLQAGVRMAKPRLSALYVRSVWPVFMRSYFRRGEVREKIHRLNLEKEAASSQAQPP